MNIKPGPKTTEFWLTVASLILSVLVTVGLLTNDDAARWYELLAPLITAIMPILVYIWSRTRVKAGLSA